MRKTSLKICIAACFITATILASGFRVYNYRYIKVNAYQFEPEAGKYHNNFISSFNNGYSLHYEDNDCIKNVHKNTVPYNKNDNNKLYCIRKIEWLSTNGRWIVNKVNNEKRLLRGVNVSGLEYDSLGNRVSVKGLTSLITNWNLNIIRLPINQDWWLNNSNYRKLLKERIEYLTSNNIYVIIDLQWINTTLKIDSLPNELSVEMWKQVAGIYKYNPGVIFDIYNEPRNCSHKDWSAKATEIVRAVRAVNSNNLILVNGIDWGYDLRGFMKEPLPFNNIVYGTHIYPVKPGTGFSDPPDYQKYWEGLLSKNLPLFIGEFGPNERNSDDQAQITKYLEPLLKEFDAIQVGYTAWSWHDMPYLTKHGKGDPDSLTLFGKEVKANLEKNNSLKK